MKAIKLVQIRTRNILGPESLWDVMLFDNFFFRVYYNMRGYVGYLPTPPDEDDARVGSLNMGDCGISAFKKETAKLNKEWAEFLSKNPDWKPTKENNGIDLYSKV